MSGITLTELARQLGIGKSTVQRALSGTGKVKVATRQRVLAAAEAAGYRRNLFFAALVAQRKRSNCDSITIHYVCRDLPRQDPHSRGKVETTLLQACAARFGMDLVMMDPSKERQPHTLARRLWNRGSAGILLGNCGEAFLEGLSAFSSLPVLNLMSAQNLPYHAVGFDVGKAVEICWQRLRAAGHRRIGFVLMQHARPNDDDFKRLATARALQEQHLAPAERIPITYSDGESEGPLKLWLGQHRPDAVISFSPGTWWACQRPDGSCIPFVTLHADTRPENRHVPGTSQPWPVHAACATEQIDLMIRTSQNGIPPNRHTLMIDPVWHEGGGIAVSPP